MGFLPARLRASLLDAPVDLRLSSVSLPRGGSHLCVSSRMCGVRIFLFALFAIPCVLLARSAFVQPAALTIVSALVFCPLLAAMAVLFGLVMARKCLDRGQRMATRSLHVFGFETSESESLPTGGIVELACRITTGGPKTPGSHRRYTVSVRPCTGLAFCTYDNYAEALEFSRTLARFLGYPIDDIVDPTHRR